MSLICILICLISVLAGLLAGRYLFGIREEDKQLIRDTEIHRDNFQNLAKENARLMERSNERLLEKDEKIQQLESVLAKATKQEENKSDKSHEEVEILKKEIESLRAELADQEPALVIQKADSEEFRKKLKKIKSEYKSSQKLIDKLRKQIKGYEKTGFKKARYSKEDRHYIKELELQIEQKSKEVKKLKNKLKKKSKSEDAASRKLIKQLESQEVINMKKLISLMKKGKLSGVNKKIFKKNKDL